MQSNEWLNLKRTFVLSTCSSVGNTSQQRFGEMTDGCIWLLKTNVYIKSDMLTADVDLKICIISKFRKTVMNISHKTKKQVSA